jgi:hypothetical protein
MKPLLLTAAALLAMNAFANGDPDDKNQPTRTTVPLEKAYVPEGFDDNDLTQVVVQGQFSDSCHKVGPTEVKADRETGKLAIVQTAYRYTDECHRVIVPFTQVVGVGILKAGNYEIDDATSNAVLGKLSVVKATKASADDFLYAPVVDADVLVNRPTRTGEVEIRGMFTDRCTKIQDIRVKTAKDTIVVQPIVKRYGDYAQCEYTPVPFRFRQKIGALDRGSYLLHVRSMSGQAVNKVVTLPALRQ